MQPLEKTLRNKLEKTVKEARDIAEAAALVSLGQLGVGEASPFKHLNDEQKELRRKLRAHGRQFGDQRDTKAETQKIDRLIEEVAYEHWHRMLFARFLAENNLLMYPDPVDPVSVTLEECEDLAADEGAKNGWELASRYAACMLPQIFRPDSPVFQLILPPEHQQKLERLLADLPPEIFTASDSLGWVYQFWQAKKKDEVNKSEVKIGARELPAVTQLFTEPYMVSFLLDNSLGAWWAARRLSEEDLKNASSEEELRKKVSLLGVPLEYLRFVKTEDGAWTPAAGTFDGWPENLSELKTLDPCCGSGHFLVAAFLMLVPMRVELEGLSGQDAVDAVLHDNLHGLEIDQRCVELAAFALALTAWSYPRGGGYRALPELHVACSGLSISTKKEDWLSLAGDNNNLRTALDELYKQFKNAPVLGSLVNPEAGLLRGTLIEMKWEDIFPLLARALSGEKDDEKAEMGVVAHGIVKAASLLAGKYQWVVTNVPYLARGNQNEELREFCEYKYSAAKNDLATVFFHRCMEFSLNCGTLTVVLPQNWLFMPRYELFRKRLLKETNWNLLARLGPGAFETISGEVVKAILLSISLNVPTSRHKFYGFKADVFSKANEKATFLCSGKQIPIIQKAQLTNPDSRILLDDLDNLPMLGKHATCIEGLSTGDMPQYVMKFWEISEKYSSWELFIQSVSESDYYSGRTDILLWEQAAGRLHRNPSTHNFPQEYMNDIKVLGNKGIRINLMGSACTIYTGEIFGKTGGTLIPFCDDELPAIWCYCNSSLFKHNIENINPSLYKSVGSFLKIPFDLDHWTRIAAEKYPNGLPKPCSEDPTQWLFHGHPTISDETLQVTVARLLGYRWPAELDAEMELSDEARAWVKKCDELISYADEDGIVCIPPVRGEAPAADQLLNLLAAAYGDSWSNDKLSELLKQADHAGKTLESWLREKFFTQHCKIFQNRPFIWHIWDGLRDGFAALVNYHKLDKKLLETLIYTYLGDWISRQKRDIDNGIDGAEEKLAAAENLKKKLELILEGEAPYDIFIRWKQIEKQPIGWDPDLNDGVRLNIRPFMSVPDVRKKGAGVLRDKPNINWNKDRGKDVVSAPWYNPDPKKHPNYKGKEGERINDYHLSLKQKREAREVAK